MSFKQLTIGSAILMLILIILSLGMNTVVDKSIKISDNIQANQTVNDPSLRTGNEPLRGDLDNENAGSTQLLGSKGTISFDSRNSSPNLFQKFSEKIMLAVLNIIDQQQEKPSSTDSMETMKSYDELLEQYPLTEEEQIELQKYTDMSPIELIQTYCENAKSPEFLEMTESIKESYNNDPTSPAMMMELFEAMAEMCPDN